MKNLTKPIQIMNKEELAQLRTRGGHVPVILSTCPLSLGGATVLYKIETDDGDEIYTTDDYGHCLSGLWGNQRETPYDLMMIPRSVKKTYYLNVYDREAYGHLQMERALRMNSTDKIATIAVDVDVEDGTGLKGSLIPRYKLVRIDDQA